MNAKAIALGGFAFYLVTWLVSMVTGPLLHRGLLDEVYRANMAFWRPELMQDPPDLAALMPRWVITGLILSFVLAALYTRFGPVISGHGWMRGARYGFAVWVLVAAVMATWTGIFNLPDSVWFWWAVEALATYVLGGAALAWAVDRWAPDARNA